MPIRRKIGSRSIPYLMRQGDYQAAERLLVQRLAEAGKNLVLVAECHSNLGNVAEAQGRIGDAFRHWSRALFVLSRLRLIESAEGERLRRLIRLWHENTPRVWASYSHRDDGRVERVLHVLRRAKIEVIYDKKFLAGHSIHRQILAAIQRCPKHVVFWSQASQQSEWVQYEKDFLDTLKKQRREDSFGHAVDNVVIFYCFDNALPKDDFSDDLQIIESNLGFDVATEKLIRSITTSEVLASLDQTQRGSR